MGNAKSRHDFHHKTDRKISRNLSQPQITTQPTSSPSSLVAQQTAQRHPNYQLQAADPFVVVNVQGSRSTTSKASRRAVATTANEQSEGGGGADIPDIRQQRRRQQKPADNSAANVGVLTEPQYQLNQQQQQRLKQASFWSLGSLNWNLSFSGRNSFKQRQKSSRKSFNTLQYSRRSKTQWHKPLTNAIFSSHFKESSRNGEFHIDHLVAKGAFGVVFRVIDKSAAASTVEKKTISERDQPIQRNPSADNTTYSSTPVYALKVLKKSKIISENSVQQIKDEADIQKLCGHHPFIVQQIDLWQNRHNLHILSEYVPNGELFSRIANFSLQLIRVYLAEIALALDFLHNAGVIYRDAKPENILLTADYHLKLTDFGLSKWLRLGLTTKTMCGTFQYMAPEILRGEAYTHSVDWWSLGIIVCQMFIKKSPDIRQFITITLPKHLQSSSNRDSVDNALKAEGEWPEVRNPTNTLKEIKDFLPEEVQWLPHEARDVLQRLLEFDGQQRLHSVRALQRIAMYKDFTIDSKYILNLRPLDIIVEDNITLYDSEDQMHYEQGGLDAHKAFQDF